MVENRSRVYHSLRPLIACSLPPCFPLSLSPPPCRLCQTESPKWYLCHGYVKKAERVLRKIIQRNRKAYLQLNVQAMEEAMRAAAPAETNSMTSHRRAGICGVVRWFLASCYSLAVTTAELYRKPFR